MLKDLYKKLSRNKTSEHLWHLEEQPEITCPMIDRTIADLNSYCAVMDSFVVKFQNVEEIKSESVDSQLQDLLSQVKDLKKNYVKINENLESLRTYLDKVRQQAQSYKDSLWQSLDYSLTLEKETFSYNNWSRANKPLVKYQDASEVMDLILEINQSHELHWNWIEDEESAELQRSITQNLAEIKSSMFSEKPLDEVLNCDYLNQWVESVMSLDAKFCGEQLVAFLEGHGYERMR